MSLFMRLARIPNKIIETRCHVQVQRTLGLVIKPGHLSPSRKVREGLADVISIHSSQLV